ncbi:hypothetical protein [Brenneria roseae]|uniref:hypothetical protein n=1 Tax=Brenneria roseae TaxID=1509241 RepID=UPI001FE4EBB6|nr:hypothetical protein [Brenneria roseae]
MKQNRITLTGSRLTIDDNVRTALNDRRFREAVMTTSDIIQTGGTRHRHSPLTIDISVSADPILCGLYACRNAKAQCLLYTELLP